MYILHKVYNSDDIVVTITEEEHGLRLKLIDLDSGGVLFQDVASSLGNALVRLGKKLQDKGDGCRTPKETKPKRSIICSHCNNTITTKGDKL